MGNPVNNLNSIDFSALIGGPLVAAVKAQMEAALASIEFIRQVGFVGGNNQQGVSNTDTDIDFDRVRNVVFSYERNGESFNLKVPILSIVPVPYIRIESIDIEFLANITAVEYEETASYIGGSVSGGLFKKFFLRASFVGRKRIRQGSEVTQRYSMSVKVKAVQDEIPSGLERILEILEDSIKDQYAQQ